MHSIPLAMTRDMLWRGRWTLPGLVLLANAVPLIMLTALRSVAAVDPNDPNMITIHLVLTQVNMWMIGVFLMSSQGPSARMYTLPVTTTTIVVWRLLPLVVLATVQGVLSTLLFNALFGLDWPLWGPALLLAVSVAVLQAIIWFAEKSFWTVPFLSLLALVYGGWMRLHYGPLFSPLERYWRQVSVVDLLVMLALLAVAFTLGVAGVARNRRGESPLSLGIVDWIWRMLSGKAAPPPTLSSPVAAQFWFEWRRKGWVMPGGAIFGLVLMLTGWAIFNRNPSDLWEGIVACGALLSVLATIGGLIIGNTGKSDSNYDLTSFIAARPLTSNTMANSILKTCGLSVLMAWAIWMVAFAGVSVVMLAINRGHLPLLPEKLDWWYFPGTLLGPWVAITLVASIALTGRGHWFTAVGGALFVAWIGWMLFAKAMLSPEMQAQIERGLTITLGLACLVATIAMYTQAWRWGLVRWPLIYVAASLWMVFSGTLVLVMVLQQVSIVPLILGAALGSGLFALAIVPFATTPLAMAWNRVR